jgi:alkylated DNA repair dioxygenase AlkB
MPRSTPNKRVNKVARTKKGNHISEYDGKREIQKLGAGDSFYIPNFIKNRQEREEIFRKILNEIDFVPMFSFMENWTKVLPIPRMVSAQTCKDNKTSAIYRMPGCNQRNINTEQWTPTVKDVCERASKEIDQELNHCVCTLYRDENDSLAFHTDKLLDLKENSVILSISFGAVRPIVFEEIHGKQKQTIMLQPGSLVAIGPKTNKRYRHAIPKLTDATGPRISLSVRTVDSYINEESGETKITGQGEEFQKKNYPYITSYEDLGGYSDEVKLQIAEFTQQAENHLAELRDRVNHPPQEIDGDFI